MIIPLRLCLRFLIEGILRVFGSFCFFGVDVWGVSPWCEFSIGLSSMSNKAEYEFDVVIDLVLKIDESKLAKPQPEQIQEKTCHVLVYTIINIIVKAICMVP